MRLCIYMILFSVLGTGNVFSQVLLKGRVVSAGSGMAVKGATVAVGEVKTVSSDQGGFVLRLPARDRSGAVSSRAVLRVSCVGYADLVRVLDGVQRDSLVLRLVPGENVLEEVTVSTGYNRLPRERATGSFVQVDNRLLERSVSTNITDRLRDVVPGLIFNRTKGLAASEVSIGIRGQSTLFANSQPLVVLDNFPYDGDISNINPNDIESITVLKDAAAASIWGARSGNGVIVLTSKRARKGQALQVGAVANVIFSPQADLTRNLSMSSADFILVEKLLFAKGFYSGTESSVVRAPLTPVVELLIARRDGKISAADADAQIAALEGVDVRREYMDHLGTSALSRQYSANLSGSAGLSSYYFSAGLDDNRLSDRLNSYQRMSLNFSDRFGFLSDRLVLDVKLLFSRSVSSRPNDGFSSLRMSPSQLIYPYAHFANDDGEALAVVKDFRSGFVNTAVANGYLDWAYRPVEDVGFRDKRSEGLDYRFNTVLRYRVIKGLEAEANFQYGKLSGTGSDLFSQDSYFARNLINRFSQVSPGVTSVYPLPLGGIMDRSASSLRTFNFRGQLNYRASVSDFELSSLAGYEWRDLEGESFTNRFYGYNPLNATSAAVDYVGSYPQSYYPPLTGVIPGSDGISGTADRFLSYYGNAALSYKGRYTLSGSVRLDKSNLFGVSANLKGVPLWSMGLMWNVAKEAFYGADFLPVLRFRLSYGYNGNIDKNLSALTTARYFNGQTTLTRQPYAVVLNPPNPELRWERVKIFNAGIDFGSKGNRVSGTLEIYRKTGLDLITDMPFAPSTGVTLFRGNMANTRVQGLDFNVNTVNTAGKWYWTSGFWMSYASEKVTKFFPSSLSTAGNYAQSADAGTLPREGYPLYGVYSYPYAGLDASGEPMGYLNGVLSTDYQAIFASTGINDMIYSGPAKPVVFGSLMNTLRFKGFGISANISYRLGYYFKRNSVGYTSILMGQGGNMDFALRWQHPGDEAFTQVPRLPESASTNRDNMYLLSNVLVERGDHVRLQDVRLSYDLEASKVSFLRSAQVYVYASNLGIIWRANKKGIDPDFQGIPQPVSLAAGIKINL
ncbi:SusC/RagA family TonB-linked outer membrane protein [Pedobacter miscanthi]|uniref:SusC/RagA family TonB-linked outer membrane protein n=1 Tax=Pedobacter miscanthi TaxID=2259170 RepID=A0A366KL46_9SPHI|nr:SusC/RagA family TonB-linked outer membrane protein [Pedobacter miscanthi]RBQ02198.1 SusC/RagA family TonB-linked outer membrane protein [Pedobacter miscanthi]